MNAPILFSSNVCLLVYKFAKIHHLRDNIASKFIISNLCHAMPYIHNTHLYYVYHFVINCDNFFDSLVCSVESKLMGVNNLTAIDREKKNLLNNCKPKFRIKKINRNKAKRIKWQNHYDNWQEQQTQEVCLKMEFKIKKIV